MRWNQLRPNERAEIKRLYESGSAVHAIAAAVGCSEETAIRIASEEGCELRGSARNKPNPRVSAAAREVLALGCTQADAARRFGVSAASVCRAVSRMKDEAA